MGSMASRADTTGRSSIERGAAVDLMAGGDATRQSVAQRRDDDTQERGGRLVGSASSVKGVSSMSMAGAPLKVCLKPAKTSDASLSLGPKCVIVSVSVWQNDKTDRHPFRRLADWLTD